MLRVYLDCCVLLNVYATGQPQEILEANVGTEVSGFSVAERALSEALFVRDGDEKSPVDFGPVIDGNALRVECLETAAEQTAFVSLAASLDDGESETAALAHCRGGAIATDDAAAMRLLARLQPPISILRTSTLIKRWSEVRSLTAAELRTALRAIRDRARFVPGIADPLRDWWVSSTE